MKIRLLLALVLVICTLAIIIGFPNKKNTPAVSLSLLSITNDAAGQRVVVFSLTKHRSVAVNPESVAYRIGDAWRWQPVPTNQTADLEALTDFSFRTQGTHPMIAAVHFPQVCPWRLRLEVIEPQAGIAGLVERLRYPRGFYRVGGVFNVLFGNKPNRWTGRAYYIETDEIH